MKLALRSRAGDFELIHLHSMFVWSTWAGARAAKRAGVPYVITPQGMLIRHLVKSRNRVAKSLWIGLIDRKNLRHAAAVHVTTETEARELRQLQLDIQRIVCVPNGLEIPAFPSLGTEASSHTPYALFLGRLSWEKGLDRLILAWTHVDNARLLIAGHDERGYLPKLKKLVLQQGMSNAIEFTGPVAGSRKWEILSKAELLVLPSYSENFGIVVLEAMAVGCPVVVTPEVGLAGMLSETGSGIVAGAEPEVFGRAVRMLVEDEDKRREMGERGRKVVRERFNLNSVAGLMESVYSSALDTSG